MRKSIVIAISTCLVSGITFSSCLAGNYSERDLRRAAEKLNKRMPMYPDKETVLNNVSTGPGLTFSYNYTLKNYRAADLKLNEFYSWMRNNIAPKVCGSTDVTKFLKSDVTVRYVYKGNDGITISDIPFTRRDCGI